MKILDKYILKTFLITFTTVFVILFFIFILQGVWLYISELAGKDLDFPTILKFLLYYAPNVIPMVLPLSVLLSSIMSFGAFSENYEFAAMKSAGISLNRAMKSLSFCILGLSLITFFFSNYVAPKAQYNFTKLRVYIVQQKPAMAIAAGQFNKIGNDINIKVDKKSGDRGQFLEGIIIHKKNNLGNGANTVIKAKNGELKSDEVANLLQLELYDGNYYEDIIPKKYEERNRVPFAKSSFKKYILNIDLSKMNTEGSMDVATSQRMLTMGQLNVAIDSLEKNYKNDVVSFTDNITHRSDIVLQSKRMQNVKKDTLVSDLFSVFNPIQQNKIADLATNNLASYQFSITNSETDLNQKEKVINSHWISIYEKFMLAFSCLLLFYIGAPLGAIIRKGGLGLPMVFSVLIFILFHFTNTFGRKLAEENSISPFLGVWLATFLLLPFAILLTYRATNDIGIMINLDWITLPFKKLNEKLNKSTYKVKQ